MLNPFKTFGICDSFCHKGRCNTSTLKYPESLSDKAVSIGFRLSNSHPQSRLMGLIRDSVQNCPFYQGRPVTLCTPSPIRMHQTV